MNPIGGYFELELRGGTEYHTEAFRVNSGRNALKCILMARKYHKVYLPYYSCEVLTTAIKELNIDFEYYPLDSQFEPVLDLSSVRKNEGVIILNYFGLKEHFITKYRSKCQNLLVDNAQAFFCKRFEGVDCFYSPRKFFGVPDGGYLYSNAMVDIALESDMSHDRFSHLLQRIEFGPEMGYEAYLQNEQVISCLPVLEMSSLTRRILDSLDYSSVIRKRRQNYNHLHSALKGINELDFEIDEQVPLVYPFLSRAHGLKEKLRIKKIYTATYWPSLLASSASLNCWAIRHSKDFVFLPIDQRIRPQELDTIIQLINNYHVN